MRFGRRSRPGAAARDDVTTEVHGDADRALPPGAAERAVERAAMVEHQLVHPRDGRAPVSDCAVVRAMRVVPRHVFVPPPLRADAYAGMPLPIGYGQTISEPYVVGLMTSLLELTPASKVLEVATGSGYQAAVLAELAAQVYTIEIREPLARRAGQTLAEQGYDDVHCRCGDGYAGWPEEAPFDGIMVACAAPHVPRPLFDQLRDGGRLVVPVGDPSTVQQLLVVTQRPDGSDHTQTVSNVRFVPMIHET